MSEHVKHDVRPEDAIMTIRIGWCEDDDGGMDFQIAFGDGLPITKPEPWMLEAVHVAGNAIELTRSKLEHAIITSFIERGRKQRAARKQLAGLTVVAEPKGQPN